MCDTSVRKSYSKEYIKGEIEDILDQKDNEIF